MKTEALLQKIGSRLEEILLTSHQEAVLRARVTSYVESLYLVLKLRYDPVKLKEEVDRSLEGYLRDPSTQGRKELVDHYSRALLGLMHWAKTTRHN